MGFGFTRCPQINEPYAKGGLVVAQATNDFSRIPIEMSPDEARLYALKLLKAADQAEEMD